MYTYTQVLHVHVCTCDIHSHNMSIMHSLTHSTIDSETAPALRGVGRPAGRGRGEGRERGASTLPSEWTANEGTSPSEDESGQFE